MGRGPGESAGARVGAATQAFAYMVCKATALGRRTDGKRLLVRTDLVGRDSEPREDLCRHYIMCGWCLEERLKE